jgi:putative CocE/NonD family hydrolase
MPGLFLAHTKEFSDMRFQHRVLSLYVSLFSLAACAQQRSADQAFIQTNYTKIEQMIPMRDGKRLYTAIYVPKDTSQAYPFLMTRTPYSCSPYGAGRFPSRLGPNRLYEQEKFIFVCQDVRGRYMSEGRFQEMTPAIDDKKTPEDVDESSDAFDTIDWLLHHIGHNNGKVGIYGISYPGFYASASLPQAHPALAAVSPQAPVTDEFDGDDANHRGAFFVMDNFSFMNFFDHPRPAPWTKYPPVNPDIQISDVYDFYLKAGPISNLNTQYFHDSSQIWNEYLQHTVKDDYWQRRNIRPHLKNVRPAVLVVGGWFDAEDLFGSLHTYEAIEKQSPGNGCRLVMGPWTHGAWANPEWSTFAGQSFGSDVNRFYRQLELDFFKAYLKGKGRFTAPEATIFFTGSNQWRQFDQWPAKSTTSTWYFNGSHLLTTSRPKGGFEEYVSDPSDPVPYIGRRSDDRINEYMAADQSFARQRKDVLSFTGPVLDHDLTIAGPITANLFVSTTGTDADFVVKLIDVHPDEKATEELVRAEIIRGKFRNSFERPEPFVPGQVTAVVLQLNDAAHTFLKGHRLMVQVQSSWFPLADRNPQVFTDIAHAQASDFKKATIRIYHDASHSSSIVLPAISPAAAAK